MYFASVSSRLLLYDTNSWEIKKSYGCYDGILRDISWSDDSKYLLQVNAKGVVEILSAADHDIRSLHLIPVKDSWSASFHRDGHKNVAIGSKNGGVVIWDTKNKSITKSFPSPTQQSNVNFISFNSKNTSLAATMSNGDTVIYGLVSNIPVLTIKLPYSKSISSMKYHQDARSILGLATDEGHIVLRDVNTNKDKAFFENVHASPVSDIVFSLQNTDVMLSCGYDKIVNIYDIRIKNVVSSIRTQNILTSMSINSENFAGLGTKSGVVMIYDLREFASPSMVLSGHEDKVNKLAFQPVKRKLTSADISLREDCETYTSPLKQPSPTRNRNSDLFYLADTPQKISIKDASPREDAKADSFLVMMGLDNSNNEIDGHENKTSEFERKSDSHEARYRQLDAEKNISKISTPLLNRQAETLAFLSPHNLNGMLGDSQKNSPKQTNSCQNCDAIQNTEKAEDLKDFIKLTLSDVADDNRNYFLHIMMALTKQKLYLEKELTNMNEQIDSMIQNQSALIDSNRKLTLEIDTLVRNQSALIESNRKLASEVDQLKSRHTFM